ncbi:MAG: PIN domain-containing protein [Gemmatimonadota bacterium]|nr:MAG: PIN domain-containing protein [Gemmatimonadota bacterium]
MSYDVLTPSVVLYEVYKKFAREKNEEKAFLVAAQMPETRSVHLKTETVLSAADLNLMYELPLTDSSLYATVQKEQCPAVTSDPHYEGQDDVFPNQ